ncbi:peptidoglycan-associated lipoprotein Pal [Roseicyclus persicicus]|uniref:Peptidoglycan-associated lipoprotein n=1 Tax=Roseicyclus persicicus TaxID=2650661 RepID=A0A7X6GXE6_9RHOB|nr:peptidoglycan-associated lipoprotein Pal [Roseibacterium persicicum]NKX44169.1 peptidoglycan-associated lipoprotein Pal [Roseibacterium persicicum]
MTFRFRASALLLTAALALSACAQGGLRDGDTTTLPGAGGAGSISDPTSIAYFNQVVGDRVLFAVDQSTLTPAAQATLDGQAQWLLTNTEYSVLIEGHADEQGTREYNLALGARRAAAVRDYLVSRGVPAGRLNTISYGKERPIEICSAEACYQQNRRAVTVVSFGTGV